MKLFFRQSEAQLGGKFPMLPMPAAKIAGITGINEAELVQTLEGMADKGLVLDPTAQKHYLLYAGSHGGGFL